MYSVPCFEADLRGGTLAATGTHHVPFTRFENIVRTLADEGTLPSPVVLQTGSSAAGDAAHDRVRVKRYLVPSELIELMERSEVVITHGGPGLIFQALAAGHVPIAVARCAWRGEAVDGHQEVFVARLAEQGLVAPARTVDDVRQVVGYGVGSTRCGDARVRTSTQAFIEGFGHLVGPPVGGVPPRPSLLARLLRWGRQ